MPSQGAQYTLQTTTEGVHEIVLNRPEKLNAMNPAMYTEIKRGLLTATADPSVEVIVIRGTGRAFATGGDLKELMPILDGPPRAVFAAWYEKYWQAGPFDTMLATPVPIIAVVEGICVAGGFWMVCCSDIVIASDAARFGTPEGRAGAVTDYVTALLTPIVGVMRAKYLAFTGEMIGAAQAERWGLVTKVSRPDEIAADLTNLISSIKRVSPDARSLYKEKLNAAFGPVSPIATVRSWMSDNSREGLTSFMQKRAPEWVSAL